MLKRVQIVISLLFFAGISINTFSQDLVSTGFGGNYLIANYPGNFTNYYAGFTITFKANHTNPVGVATMKVGAAATINIVNTAGSALTAGDILADQYVTIIYNTTASNFEMVTTPGNMGGGGGVAGSGTINYVPKWNTTTVLTNSLLFDDGTKVGIGTTSPAALFHVKGTSDPLEILLENTGGAFKTGLHVKSATREWLVGMNGTVDFTLKDITSNLVRLDIDMNGNVGIGTTSPSYRLHLTGSSTSNMMLVENTEGTVGGGLVVKSASSSAGNPFMIETGSTSRFIVRPNGNVGIGTTTPLTALHVSGTTPTYITVENTTAASPHGIVFKNPTREWNIINQTGGSDRLSFYDSNSSQERIVIDGLTGNVGIGVINPGYKLEVNGRLKTTGVNEISDTRYKTNVSTISSALKKVLSLRGVNFSWDTEKFKDKNFDSGKQMGLIAQEVEKIVPEVVQTDKDGYKSVEYSKLVGLLIEAIKEQQQRIETLETENSKLKTDNSTTQQETNSDMAQLKVQVADLKSALELLLKLTTQSAK